MKKEKLPLEFYLGWLVFLIQDWYEFVRDSDDPGIFDVLVHEITSIIRKRFVGHGHTAEDVVDQFLGLSKLLCWFFLCAGRIRTSTQVF